MKPLTPTPTPYLYLYLYLYLLKTSACRCAFALIHSLSAFKSTHALGNDVFLNSVLGEQFWTDGNLSDCLTTGPGSASISARLWMRPGFQNTSEYP